MTDTLANSAMLSLNPNKLYHGKIPEFALNYARLALAI
jgi:hypothetical protein